MIAITQILYTSYSSSSFLNYVVVAVKLFSSSIMKVTKENSSKTHGNVINGRLLESFCRFL